ncbi:PDZ domain-containing protein [Glaciecola sp. SC05]|uniref:PDZ domain-containing protein n=1 Tax=Glaciecola sp. SC05 TaxID=1987355 RepID=UPI00352873FF
MQNRLTSIVLLLGLLAAVVYSVVTLDQSISSDRTDKADTRAFNLNGAGRADNRAIEYQAYEPVTSRPLQNTAKQDQELTPALPIVIQLKGIEVSAGAAKCLLESAGILGEFEVGDLLYDRPIQLLDILSNSVILGFENHTYEIVLSGPNLLEQALPQTHSELLGMPVDKIGNRPQIVEHFVQLTPTPFIADGMLASPGINPDLFAQAGLKEDDVITTINGKSVTLADEFEELQRTMRYADTLVITAMRKGRVITLYLDIPSEALTLKRQ